MLSCSCLHQLMRNCKSFQSKFGKAKRDHSHLCGCSNGRPISVTPAIHKTNSLHHLQQLLSFFGLQWMRMLWRFLFILLLEQWERDLPGMWWQQMHWVHIKLWMCGLSKMVTPKLPNFVYWRMWGVCFSSEPGWNPRTNGKGRDGLERRSKYEWRITKRSDYNSDGKWRSTWKYGATNYWDNDGQ